MKKVVNLHCSKDEDEYKYAAGILELSNRQIDNSKKYSYTLSFCPISALKNKTIWETYGEDFKGAAIILTLENDLIEWVNFHIAEVKYDVPDSFHAYQKRAQGIEAEYKGINLSCNLSKLICFLFAPVP
jgi:hypothetical protein